LGFLKHVYRLDVEQSGVLVLARQKETFTILADLFGSEKPLLQCVFLAQGVPNEPSFDVDRPIAPHPVRPDIVTIDPRQGKQSRTLFEVVEGFESCSLMRARPLTLRPHQIRVHLRHVGHPVVGDSLYGGQPLRLSRLKAEYRLKPNRQERPLLSVPLIHFERLEMPHPVTGQPLNVTAPIPREMAVALKYLRKFRK
jgi:23S rRNA-/tRNA-specific pseudouridylate synthase